MELAQLWNSNSTLASALALAEIGTEIGVRLGARAGVRLVGASTLELASSTNGGHSFSANGNASAPAPTSTLNSNVEFLHQLQYKIPAPTLGRPALVRNANCSPNGGDRFSFSANGRAGNGKGDASAHPQLWPQRRQLQRQQRTNNGNSNSSANFGIEFQR